MEKEKLIGLVNVGKTAEISLGHLIPLLQEEFQAALESLKNQYRSGRYDQSKIVAELARLVVVDNLEARLKSQISASMRARKELEK